MGVGGLFKKNSAVYIFISFYIRATEGYQVSNQGSTMQANTPETVKRMESFSSSFLSLTSSFFPRQWRIQRDILVAWELQIIKRAVAGQSLLSHWLTFLSQPFKALPTCSIIIPLKRKSKDLRKQLRLFYIYNLENAPSAAREEL